jgi:hypothetical protein
MPSDALAQRLGGYSGADIKYLCERAATIPFLRSVASGEAGSFCTVFNKSGSPGAGTA